MDLKMKGLGLPWGISLILLYVHVSACFHSRGRPLETLGSALSRSVREAIDGRLQALSSASWRWKSNKSSSCTKAPPTRTSLWLLAPNTSLRKGFRFLVCGWFMCCSHELLWIWPCSRYHASGFTEETHENLLLWKRIFSVFCMFLVSSTRYFSLTTTF